MLPNLRERDRKSRVSPGLRFPSFLETIKLLGSMLLTRVEA